MARREDIVNTFWDEVDHLSDDAVMLYFWSWTNTKSGMAGIYKIARRKLVEGRFDEARLDAALHELEADGKLFYADGVLWCKSRVKRLSGISEQIAKSIAKDLHEIDPANPLLVQFVQRYGNHPKLEPHLNLIRGSAEGRENGAPTGDGRPSVEGHETLPGRGQGPGRGRGQGRDYGAEFDDWLEHYWATTGRTGVRGSKPAREAFVARRKEDWSVEELKEATVGCHSDPWRREHSHDVPETILRRSKVTGYIQAAQQAPPGNSGERLSADLDELETERQRLLAEEGAA